MFYLCLKTKKLTKAIKSNFYKVFVSPSNKFINAAICDSETKYNEDYFLIIFSDIFLIIGFIIKLAIIYLFNIVVPNSKGPAILEIYLEF